MTLELKPLSFISEIIKVEYSTSPMFEKKPGPPDRFIWRGEIYHIEEVILEWHDYRRRGRMTNNMRPAHADNARRRGSWGVGQFYFRVRTRRGRFFDIYYDRAPKNVDERKGGWFLYRELSKG
jgi:hypothetical protein